VFHTVNIATSFSACSKVVNKQLNLANQDVGWGWPLLLHFLKCWIHWLWMAGAIEKKF